MKGGPYSWEFTVHQTPPEEIGRLTQHTSSSKYITSQININFCIVMDNVNQECYALEILTGDDCNVCLHIHLKLLQVIMHYV